MSSAVPSVYRNDVMSVLSSMTGDALFDVEVLNIAPACAPVSTVVTVVVHAREALLQQVSLSLGDLYSLFSCFSRNENFLHSGRSPHVQGSARMPRN